MYICSFFFASLFSHSFCFIIELLHLIFIIFSPCALLVVWHTTTERTYTKKNIKFKIFLYLVVVMVMVVLVGVYGACATVFVQFFATIFCSFFHSRHLIVCLCIWVGVCICSFSFRFFHITFLRIFFISFAYSIYASHIHRTAQSFRFLFFLNVVAFSLYTFFGRLFVIVVSVVSISEIISLTLMIKHNAKWE